MVILDRLSEIDMDLDRLYLKGHTSGSRDGRLEENVELTDTVPTPYDLPLTGGYTPGSDEDEEGLSVHIEDSPKQGRIIEEMDKDKNINLVSEQGEVQETVEPSRYDDDTTLAETLLNIKKSEAKDKGKGIMQETELPKKKDDVPKGDQAKDIDWNDPQMLRYHALQNIPFSKAEVRKNMIMYLKNQGGYKQNYFKGIKYEDIKPLFERVWDQVHTFLPKDSEIEKEVMKRPGFDLQQGSAKKQRLDQQTEETEEEVEAKDNSDQEVEELKTLWKLVKDKYGNTRPEEGYEGVLWGDLKVMFELDIESEMWRQLQGHEVTV
uniref:Uncharacterized protein n=1 Tax=Tanacetum cinerariifolium TaxID=118510 RepID=A0A6L2N3Y0_TANCI|nr:hypothetical protein [Tanacetum cinerariifolium]